MKFSIRQMLIGMIGMALFAAAAGAGANGSALGFGLAVSLSMLVIFFAVFAAIYWTTCICFSSARAKPDEKSLSPATVISESNSVAHPQESES